MICLKSNLKIQTEDNCVVLAKQKNITIKKLDRISPLAVPLILEINRQTIDKSEMEEYFLEELENEMLSEVGLN